MCWLQHRGWSVVELQSTHLSFATQAPPPQFQLPITTSIVVTSKIAENNMQRLCPVDTVNVDDQTHVQFLTLFVIRSGPDLFRFQLKQCNACITVSAVCNRRAQQDLIHTDHDHFGRSFRLRPRKADKIVVLGLCEHVTRLHQGGLDKLSHKTYKESKEPRTGKRTRRKIGSMPHALKDVLKVSVQSMFYMLHQARAHGDSELFRVQTST